jgi:chemotaxis protein CheC
MNLTERQKDSLVELINIAFGRAAASLSSLTGQRVLLSVPKVSLHPIHELRGVFGKMLTGEVATVHQIFTGSVAGNALLLLDYEGAVALSGLLSENRAPVKRLDESDREVLTEVGNILLNACLGTFGNLLQVHISFSVPRLHVDSLNTLLHSLTIGSEELQYALVVATTFNLRDSDVGGYLVMVLGVASLDHLIQSIERLG